MNNGAAFFDLDRTLLAGASGEVFSRALKDAGVVTRSVPGQRAMYQIFNLIGETLPAMALARQAVQLAKGHSRAAVRRAADGVADDLVAMVQPLAWSLFEMHRDEGRSLVLATTTPFDLVEPFAERLGFDGVVATRYAVGRDGDTYNGTIDGPFTWATGKLAAVERYATDHDIDMRASFAYSDSVYDSFLLGAVGHPVVVNPDPRMVMMAAARRWPTIDLAAGGQSASWAGTAMGDDRASGRTASSRAGDLQRIAMSFARPELIPFADIQISGADTIPTSGPVILVGNHRSYFDPTVMGMVVAQSGRTVRFLGKKEVFDAPVVGQIASAMGGIRVDRGTGSDAPLKAAAQALENGDMVAIMPQGTIPRGPAFFDPVLKGRWGAARLAAMTKAPVIPVGLWGTEKVWPRSSRLPDVLNITDAPTVTAHVGEPVDLAYRSLARDTERIMAAISALLPPEANEPYEPTAEELARTYPPGYSGDPDAEAERRPGTDS